MQGKQAEGRSIQAAKERFDAGKPIRILHVEDDPAHAELVRRGFEGHRRPSDVRQVDNGQSALDYLFRRGEFSDPLSSPMPDVILLDLRMPGMDGLEFLERIRSDDRTRELPVVILTTSEAEHDKLESYEHTISGYIVKPLDFDGFGVLLDVIYLVLTR